MVLEDLTDHMFLVRKALEHKATQLGRNVEFIEVHDARTCLERAETANADVIVVDLNLPGMNGYELLPRLRALVPDTKIVVLTTAHNLDAEKRVLDLGADAFIRKPMRILELGDLLCEALVRASTSPLG